MKNTLIVPFDQTKFYFGLAITFIVTIALVLLLFFISNLEPHLGHFLILLLRIVLISLIALFSFGLVYGCFQDLKRPAATLSPEGIWLNNHGFIPWDKITDIATYRIAGAPLDVVGILLKDPASVSKQSSFSGKCVLFWAKLFGYRYHINLSCITLSNSEVVSYAQQYLK